MTIKAVGYCPSLLWPSYRVSHLESIAFICTNIEVSFDIRVANSDLKCETSFRQIIRFMLPEGISPFEWLVGASPMRKWPVLKATRSFGCSDMGFGGRQFSTASISIITVAKRFLVAVSQRQSKCRALGAMKWNWCPYGDKYPLSSFLPCCWILLNSIRLTDF